MPMKQFGKKMGLLTAQGKQIKHSEELLKLLEAVLLPQELQLCTAKDIGKEKQTLNEVTGWLTRLQKE